VKPPNTLLKSISAGMSLSSAGRLFITFLVVAALGLGRSTGRYQPDLDRRGIAIGPKVDRRQQHAVAGDTDRKPPLLSFAML